MQTYSTHEVAARVQVHPNTVRLYEKLHFITEAKRSENGYRVFTDVQVQQIQLARLGLRAEVLQHGLRDQVLSILYLVSDGFIDEALRTATVYKLMLEEEMQSARKAIESVQSLLEHRRCPAALHLNRKEASKQLGLSIDILRNWELNGLITAKRRANGYRIYDEQDVQRLLIIRTLRLANYSLMAILRLLNHLDSDCSVDLEVVLNTPSESEDIVSVCDRLMVSLARARDDAKAMILLLEKMLQTNPPVCHQTLQTR